MGRPCSLEWAFRKVLREKAKLPCLGSVTAEHRHEELVHPKHLVPSLSAQLSCPRGASRVPQEMGVHRVRTCT